MRAVVLNDYQTFPTIEEVEKPTPGPGEVLLNVAGRVPATPTWRSTGSALPTCPVRRNLHSPWVMKMRGGSKRWVPESTVSRWA